MLTSKQQQQQQKKNQVATAATTHHADRLVHDQDPMILVAGGDNIAINTPSFLRKPCDERCACVCQSETRHPHIITHTICDLAIGLVDGLALLLCEKLSEVLLVFCNLGSPAVQDCGPFLCWEIKQAMETRNNQ